MATAKIVNYTAEQTAMMIAEYTANPSQETVVALAEKLGKATKSVIAKLAREKVYHAKEYVGKTGEKPIKKDTHADAIGKVLGLAEGDIDSLTKANKRALEAIWGFIVEKAKADTPETPVSTPAE